MIPLVATLACHDFPSCPAVIDEDHNRVVELVRTIEREASERELLSLGESCLPSLYRIVSGEELDERKLNYLFRIVSKMPGDRSRFVELAGRMLTSDRVRSLGSFSGALKLIRETKCMDYGPQILRRLTYDEFGIDSTVLSTLEIVATADDLKALEKKYRENASYLGSEDSPDGMAIRFKSTIRSIQKRLYPEENADGP